MHPTLKWILGGGGVRPGGGFDGFDNLLQTFENCRTGLADETIAEGQKAVSDFFLDLYQKEAPRFRETLHLQDPHLKDSEKRQLFEKVDQLVRKVVVPSYARQRSTSRGPNPSGSRRMR